MLVDWNILASMLYGNIWLISALMFIMFLGLAIAFRMSVPQFLIAMIVLVFLLGIRFHNPTLNIIGYFAVTYLILLAVYKLLIR